MLINKGKDLLLINFKELLENGKIISDKYPCPKLKTEPLTQEFINCFDRFSGMVFEELIELEEEIKLIDVINTFSFEARNELKLEAIDGLMLLASMYLSLYEIALSIDYDKKLYNYYNLNVGEIKVSIKMWQPYFINTICEKNTYEIKKKTFTEMIKIRRRIIGRKYHKPSDREVKVDDYIEILKVLKKYIKKYIKNYIIPLIDCRSNHKDESINKLNTLYQNKVDSII